MRTTHGYSILDGHTTYWIAPVICHMMDSNVKSRVPRWGQDIYNYWPFILQKMDGFFKPNSNIEFGKIDVMTYRILLYYFP